MQLNDPFGRVSRNNRRAYTMLRQRLMQEGSRRRGRRQDQGEHQEDGNPDGGHRAGCAAVPDLGLPQSRGPLAGLGVLALAWFAANYLLTSTYLRRYLREECGRGNGGPAAE